MVKVDTTRPAIGDVAIVTGGLALLIGKLIAVGIVWLVARGTSQFRKCKRWRCFFSRVMASRARRNEVCAGQRKARCFVVPLQAVGRGKPTLLCVAVGAERAARRLGKSTIVVVSVTRETVVHSDPRIGVLLGAAHKG